MNRGEGNREAAKIERVRKEASDWIAKHDRGFSGREQDAFFDWLAADPLHAELFEKRRAVWKELNVLADWRPEHSLEPNPDLLAVQSTRSVGAWFWAVTAAAALLCVGLFVSWSSQQGDAVVMLASGEGAQYYEYHVLEDGTAVELNRGAQVSVRFSKDKRIVDLLSGEAYFTVSKDQRRPFVVRARGAVVQAVGTAFNVSLNSDTVEVLVSEGKVLMNPSIATTVDSLIVETEPLVRALTAGQRSRVNLDEVEKAPVVEEVSLEEMEARLSWKNEMLDFTDAPLSDVILEFNRRNHTQIVIGDSELNGLKVNAALKPQNVECLVDLLEMFEGVRADRNDATKVVLYKWSE